MKKMDVTGIAGIASTALAAVPTLRADDSDRQTPIDRSASPQTFTNTFLNADTRNLFAAHRSHSSHR